MDEIGWIMNVKRVEGKSCNLRKNLSVSQGKELLKVKLWGQVSHASGE